MSAVTATPPIASDGSITAYSPGGTLTFSNNGLATGYSQASIGEIIQADTIVKSNGTLSVVVSLKLTVLPGQINPAPINSYTAFVNVVLQSKIGGAPVIFENRKYREELVQLQGLLVTDPGSAALVRFGPTGVVTHIKFTFDNVLLPGLDGLLPNEVLGCNAYEQNTGGPQGTGLGFGNNFSVAYQNVASNLQGINISIAQNPGRPTVSFNGGAQLSSATNPFLQATIPLRITFPSNNGGSKLRTYNIFMMVESLNGNKVVAQLLNQAISDSNISNNYVDIEAFGGTVTTSQSLVFNQLNDGDIVYYVASVDNLALRESALSIVSSSASFPATLRVPKPSVTGYRSAEILLPTGVDNAYAAIDIPGVKFTFTADLASTNWNYVSVWAKPAGAAANEQYRMSQMWPRAGDVTSQLSSNGFCEKTWNQKFIVGAATSTTDSTTNSAGVLPAMTAFDIYVVLSFNPDIALVGTGATPPSALNVVGDNIGFPIILNQQASQSNPSDVVRVITSLYRPALQTVSTISNIGVSPSTTLTLNSTYPSFVSVTNQVSTAMPLSHVQSYYSSTTAFALLLRSTLRANDFTNNNQLIFDGEVSSTNFNASTLTVVPGSMPPPFALNLQAVTASTAATGWQPTYSFSLKNVNLYQLKPETVAAINTTDPRYISPTVKDLIVSNPLNSTQSQTKYLSYYTFSTLEPIRTRPVDATLQYLPKTLINSIQESRLISSGSGLNPTYGNTQLAVLLNSVQSFNTFPYKWSSLEVGVSNSESFTAGPGVTIISNTLNNDAALLAEILYLAQSLSLNNGVVAPQTGLVTGTIFSSFLPGTTYYVRVRPTYTWSGSLNATASIDASYTPPNYYGDAAIPGSVVAQFLTSSLPPVPSPTNLSVVFQRQRALKLVGTVVQSEPTLFLIPGVGNESSKVTLFSTIFQLVNGLNVPFTFSGSRIEVPYTSGAVGSLISASFTIPANQLDQFLNVSVSYKYKLLSNDSFLLSAPVRSADQFYEKPPNVILMEVRETGTTVQCIAHIDLGVNDQVPINTVANSVSSGGLISNGLYNNQGMFLTALIPAMATVNSVLTETFAHNMVFVPLTNTTGYYQTAVLTKIANPDIYNNSSGTPNTSFIVIVNNNTGTAIAMFPNRSNQNGTWNINTSVSPLSA